MSESHGSSRHDGLEDFPHRFDDNWTNYDSADLASLQNTLPMLGFNTDADSIYFARALDYVKARAYARPMVQMSGERLVPTSRDTPASAESVSYSVFDEVGMAKIISNYADDLPRADVRARELSVKIRSLGDSYGYTQQDMRAALASRSNLPGRKADAARTAIARKENALKIKGDAEYGMFGITNHPNIPVVVPTTGDWENATTTGDMIAADMNALLNAIVNQSNGAHTPTVVGMSNQARAVMFAKMRSGGAGNISAGDSIRAQYPGVEFVVAQELRDAAAGGFDYVFAAERDEDNYYYDQAMAFLQHPPQPRNLEMVVPCEARTGGLIVVRPLSMAVMGGI